MILRIETYTGNFYKGLFRRNAETREKEIKSIEKKQKKEIEKER